MTHSPALKLARDALTRFRKTSVVDGLDYRMADAALEALDSELAASADAGKLAEEAKRYVNDLANWRETDDARLHEAAWQAAIMSINSLAALARPSLTTAPVSAQGDERAAAGPWKCGNEFLPYHPSASHVEPSYRDGWNACYKAGLAARAQVAQGDEVDAWAELCRRVYVELFYCDQQMTSGRKKWQQGPSVRDALRDAKAALEARDAARAQQGGAQ